MSVSHLENSITGERSFITGLWAALQLPFATFAVLAGLAAAALLMPNLLTMSGNTSVSTILIPLPFIFIAILTNIAGSVHNREFGLLDAAALMLIGYLFLRNYQLVTLEYFLLGAGVYYLASIVAVRPKYFRKIILAIAGLGALTSVIGLLERLFLKNDLFDLYMTPTPDHSGIHRIASTLLHPAVFGTFLVFTIPFTALLYFTSGSRRERLFGIGAIGLELIAILLSISKSSLLIVICFGVIFAIWALVKRHKYLLMPMAGLLIVLAISGIVFFQPLSQSVRYRLFDSVNERTYRWDATIHGIEKTRALGVGWGSGPAFLARINPNVRTYMAKGRTLPIDNFYLSFILEQGYAGFLWLFLFLAVLFGQSIIAAIRSRSNRPWLMTAMTAMAGICLNIITFDGFSWWPVFVIFWLTAGILRGISNPWFSGSWAQSADWLGRFAAQ